MALWSGLSARTGFRFDFESAHVNCICSKRKTFWNTMFGGILWQWTAPLIFGFWSLSGIGLLPLYIFFLPFLDEEKKRTLLLHKMLGSIAMGLLVPCYVALRIHTHMQTQTSVTFIFFTLNRRQYVVLLSAQPICFRCRRLKSYTKISPGKKCCFFFHNSD